jgi:hypothetical protein
VSYSTARRVCHSCCSFALISSTGGVEGLASYLAIRFFLLPLHSFLPFLPLQFVGLEDERGLSANVSKGALLEVGLLLGGIELVRAESDDVRPEIGAAGLLGNASNIKVIEYGDFEGPVEGADDRAKDGCSDGDPLGGLDEREGPADGCPDGVPLGGLDEREGPADGCSDGDPLGGLDEREGPTDGCSDGDPLGGLDEREGPADGCSDGDPLIGGLGERKGAGVTCASIA